MIPWTDIISILFKLFDDCPNDHNSVVRQPGFFAWIRLRRQLRREHPGLTRSQLRSELTRIEEYHRNATPDELREFSQEYAEYRKEF